MSIVPSGFFVTNGVLAGTSTFVPMEAGMTQGLAIVQIRPGFAGLPVPSKCDPRVPTYPTSNNHPFPRSRWMLKFHCRSEEHTSELQSRLHLVCRLLLEKKKKNIISRCQHYTMQTFS